MSKFVSIRMERPTEVREESKKQNEVGDESKNQNEVRKGSKKQNDEGEKNKIQTFVFLDLEATGLPGDSPRILELSMIAVSRDDFLGMKDSSHKGKSTPSDPNSTNENKRSIIPQLPRVLHKYTRLYYPRKLIMPAVEDITGLSNELLHRLPGFSEASAEAIRLFLDLPQPLSLVAHNGNRYDFPLLKAELSNVCSTEKYSNFYCVDTLKAIKDIDAVQERDKELKDISEITVLAASFSFGDMDDEEMEVTPVSKRTRSEELAEERVTLAPHGYTGSSCSNKPSSHAPEGNQRTFEVSAEPYITPVKDHIPAKMNKTPKTPNKHTKPLLPPATPESFKPCTPGTPGFNSQTFTEANKVRRSLVYDGYGKRKWDGTMPYKLGNIYRRLFHANYQAHRAESDCQAMLQICGHYGERFVQWADTFSERFADVKPLWVKRKTFQLT
ncbi:uncharacterized protein LOC121862338 [Homarus americanus]|uniref:Three-prime repair exonuclease 1-like n=1 Tax=Homarus americanus TaxID=6706 RepID=A0A8J5N290_HOMAM|nr:uncharacterized protein LOC121862338 [Homarus americanus]KAG7171881.1 Three-prime repair exonuclease 1-like [Homarus americanus]